MKEKVEMTMGMGMEMPDEEKPKTKFVRQPPDEGIAEALAATLMSKYPDLDLSGQRLGGASKNDRPYLIAGKWGVVDLTESFGHVIVHGFVNRLILNSASGIFVHLIGAFGFVEAQNIGCDDQGSRSWIDLNGGIFEIDLRGSSTERLELIHSIAEPGCHPPLEKARTGKVKINPFDIRYVISETPGAWRKAIANNCLEIQENLNLFARRGIKE